MPACNHEDKLIDYYSVMRCIHLYFLYTVFPAAKFQPSHLWVKMDNFSLVKIQVLYPSKVTCGRNLSNASGANCFPKIS